jgi:hypothetical protein
MSEQETSKEGWVDYYGIKVHPMMDMGVCHKIMENEIKKLRGEVDVLLAENKHLNDIIQSQGHPWLD